MYGSIGPELTSNDSEGGDKIMTVKGCKKMY